jgi:protease I
MHKRVAILAEDDCEDLELWYPLIRLKGAGHEVVVVGSGRKEVFHSKHGYEVKADLPTPKAKVGDLDALVIPGGFAPDRLRRFTAVNELVKQMHQNGKLVAAICHAPSVLISANILRGRKVTCFTSIKDDVMNAGVRYLDEAVVVDVNIITARGPADLPEFMKEILQALR